MVGVLSMNLTDRKVQLLSNAAVQARIILMAEMCDRVDPVLAEVETILQVALAECKAMDDDVAEILARVKANAGLA